jgi:hypothetical protein
LLSKTVYEFPVMFTVSVFDMDDPTPDADLFSLTVAYRGRSEDMTIPKRNRERWSITRGGYGISSLAYDIDGKLALDTGADNQRFTYTKAMALARDIAPGMTINGYVASDVYRESRGR